MNEVSIRHDEYIVERAGKPLVAIIPISEHKKIQKGRDQFFKMVDKIHKRVKDVDPKVIDDAIDEAIVDGKKKDNVLYIINTFSKYTQGLLQKFTKFVHLRQYALLVIL